MEPQDDGVASELDQIELSDMLVNNINKLQITSNFELNKPLR